MQQFKLVDYFQEKQETAILHEEHLREILTQIQKENTRIVDLTSPEGDCLAIGIGNPYGCVMHMNKSGAPPYLWAVGEVEKLGEYVEFSVEGTPTPVPIHRCLPFDEVIDIAAYYLKNAKLPECVAWEAD